MWLLFKFFFLDNFYFYIIFLQINMARNLNIYWKSISNHLNKLFSFYSIFIFKFIIIKLIYKIWNFFDIENHTKELVSTQNKMCDVRYDTLCWIMTNVCSVSRNIRDFSHECSLLTEYEIYICLTFWSCFWLLCKSNFVFKFQFLISQVYQHYQPT